MQKYCWVLLSSLHCVLCCVIRGAKDLLNCLFFVFVGSRDRVKEIRTQLWPCLVSFWAQVILFFWKIPKLHRIPTVFWHQSLLLRRKKLRQHLELIWHGLSQACPYTNWSIVKNTDLVRPPFALTQKTSGVSHLTRTSQLCIVEAQKGNTPAANIFLFFWNWCHSPLQSHKPSPIYFTCPLQFCCLISPGFWWESLMVAFLLHHTHLCDF